MSTATITRSCGKCDGTGRINAFPHVAGGACFTCGGRGTITTTAKSEAARKRRAAKRTEDEEARREAYVTARMRSFIEAGATFADYHDASCSCGDAEVCGTTYGTRARFEELAR